MKNAIYLLFILTAFFTIHSCNEDDSRESLKNEYVKKELTFIEFLKIEGNKQEIQKIQKYFQGHQSNILNKGSDSLNWEIDTAKVNLIITPEVTTYTFGVIEHDTITGFRNVLVKKTGNQIQTYLIHYPEGVDFENHTTRNATGEELEGEIWNKDKTCFEVVIYTVTCDDNVCEYGWELVETTCSAGGGDSDGDSGSGSGTPTGPIEGGFPPGDGNDGPGGGGSDSPYNAFLNLLSTQQLQWLNQSQNSLLRSQLYTYLNNSNYSDQSIDFAIEFVIFCQEEGDILQKLKQAIAGGITTTSEYTHKVFKKCSELVSQYPSTKVFINTFLQGLSNGVSYLVNKNPDTCNFTDLFNMWLFELGSNPININGIKVTTNQLKDQQGVSQARMEAIVRIQTGTFINYPIVNHGWTYGQTQFYDGMQNGNFVTAFLGSYTTKITITQISNGYQLNFQVSNTSSWESATRFRIDNNGDGIHDGIFPNTFRTNNNDIRLGGNFTQNWSWTEIIN